MDQLINLELRIARIGEREDFLATDNADLRGMITVVVFQNF